MRTLYAVARPLGLGKRAGVEDLLRDILGDSGLLTYRAIPRFIPPQLSASAAAPEVLIQPSPIGGVVVFTSKDSADKYVDSLPHGIAKHLTIIPFYEDATPAPPAP